jgi:hypothetical protein
MVPTHLMQLDPELKKGGWTDEEDRRIVAAHSKLGNRWHEMAKCIKGRYGKNMKFHVFNFFNLCVVTRTYILLLYE